MEKIILVLRSMNRTKRRKRMKRLAHVLVRRRPRSRLILLILLFPHPTVPLFHRQELHKQLLRALVRLPLSHRLPLVCPLPLQVRRWLPRNSRALGLACLVLFARHLLLLTLRTKLRGRFLRLLTWKALIRQM